MPSSNSAPIQGTVTDQTRGVLPGVTVNVRNIDTGVTRTTVSNDTGIYRVPSLEPGRYAISAELQGFRTARQEPVIISVGATIGANFTMQPGTVEETVQVTGTAPDIQTERAEVSAVVERKKINDLPLVGRNVLSLRALQPGILGIPSSADFLTPEQGFGVTANGVRGSGNSASIDGADITGGPWGGTVLVVPNVEAVQEFQVISNNPSAEYRRNSGATVSIITKGGTNNWSGSAFEFHRNENLRARLLREPQPAQGRLPPQQLRRPDQARSRVLLRVDGGRARADGRRLQRDRRDEADRGLGERDAAEFDGRAALPAVRASRISDHRAGRSGYLDAGCGRVEHNAGRHPRCRHD
jgi:carboxypeptidase family protein